MERRAKAAEALVAQSNDQEALDNAIRAAELYMSAAAKASTKAEGTRLRRKCQELIGYAERLKSKLIPKLSPEEVILRDASRLHGNSFPPWDSEPNETEFQYSPSGGLFLDDAIFTLSPTQTGTFAGWQRPAELIHGLGPRADETANADVDLERAFFSIRMETCDLVQDVTTDCSVVAGLSAAINILIGKRSSKSSFRGTGCISPEEEEATGLVGEHDYAVQGLRDEEGLRLMLVKNPWCNGPVWTGGWQSTAQKSYPGSSTARDSEYIDAGTEGRISGALWVTLEDVAQNFESMYLNWNRDLFPHRQHRHFTWEMPPPHLRATLACNPQFSVVAPSGGLLWMLVSRHFQDAELEIVRRRTESMAAAARQLGFMSILVFDSGGNRVQVTGEETYRGPYVDSPQTLARLDTTAGKCYTVVLDQHEFPLSKYTFTLTLFIRLSIVHGWGPDRVTLAVSGNNEFRDSAVTLRTPEFDIEPERVRTEGMWLVVESMGQHNGHYAMEGEIFSDSPVQVGAWEAF
ncbi:cysteine protease [Amphichorda felina]